MVVDFYECIIHVTLMTAGTENIGICVSSA